MFIKVLLLFVSLQKHLQIVKKLFVIVHLTVLFAMLQKMVMIHLEDLLGDDIVQSLLLAASASHV